MSGTRKSLTGSRPPGHKAQCKNMISQTINKNSYASYQNTIELLFMPMVLCGFVQIPP